MKIGILGAGQLGRMLALAGYRLGQRFRVFDTSPEAPAGHLAELHVGAWNDQAALARFCDGLEVVTFEFENVALEAAAYCGARTPLWPPLAALEMGQDRIKEKECFHRLEIPSAEFRTVETIEELRQACSELSLPLVLKTVRMGYDGKGQYVLRSLSEIETAWKQFDGRAIIAEQFIPFDRELSVVAVRNAAGETRYYPVGQNTHQAGILRTSQVPAPQLSQELQRQAEDYASRILNACSYVGVFALELFEYRNTLYANETAPRVHNTGHWTMDGAVTCQFENHVRAICGLPLGSTALRCPTTMINLIGEMPLLNKICALDGVFPHLYGKTSRPGRKIGHLNVIASSAVELTHRVTAVQALLAQGSHG